MANPKNGQSASGRSAQPTGSSSTGASPSWGTRIANLFRPNFGKDSPQRGSSRLTRIIFGTLIFVFVGQLFYILLGVLNSWLKLGLEQPIVKSASWLTPLLVIYFLLIIGLWFALNYFGFFPRPEPLPSNRTASGSSSGGKKGPSQIPGIGGPRARGRRVEAAPPAANGRKGATDTAKTAPSAKAAAKPSATTKENGGASSEYDEAYERVKAAQRQKRRRELR